MSSKTPPFLNKSHNFGIFLKKGKRGVLQLDFPSQMILLIQRGHIKKTQPFHSLLYFESEEDLHIALRFLDNDLDFDADTSEEKYTICRLLDLILEAENAETPNVISSGVPVLPRVPIVPHTVVRDGLLEKKGNTTITTWNRRRVKISVGEFSYFKPGEELALNVVQLRQDKCRLQRVGQNTIHLTVGQRIYCFRVPNDSRSHLSVEAVRDDWIKAFDQAMTMKRSIKFTPSSPDLPSPDYDVGQPDSEPMSDVSSVDDSPFVTGRKELDTASDCSDVSNQEITASVSVSFSYNQQSSNINDGITTTTTMVNTRPPRPAKRPTIYPFRRQNRKDSDSRLGYSGDVVSRPHPDSVSDELPVTALRAKFITHGSADRGPAQNAINGPKSSSLKESKAKTLNDRVLAFSDLSLGEGDPKVLGRRETAGAEPRQQAKISAGNGKKSVFDVWDEKLAVVSGKSLSSSPSFDLDDRRPESGQQSGDERRAKDDLGKSLGGVRKQLGRERKPGNAIMKASSMSDLLDIIDEDKSVRAERPKTPDPPPLPAVPAPPFLAPPLPGRRGIPKGGIKLKQVHWTPVEKNQVSVSLWGEGKMNLPTFDLKLLETTFSISDREGTTIGKHRAVKQSLLDTKRAQNLGILFSGFKADSLTQLLDALSSVTELESFQLQKMATLKRFQPTAEDMEMYRMYRQSSDSLEPVDRFMLDLCDIPKLSMRIDLALTLWDLPTNYQALLEEVEDLLKACEALVSNTHLPVVLRCLLAIGNHLNAKRQSKDVPGFQISSVDKMVDLKGRDPQYSLMIFLVEQLHTTKPDLLHWTASLDLVPKVAGYSVRAIGAEIEVLKNDVQKVKKYQKGLKGASGVQKKFQSDVQNFVLEYEKRMQTIQDKMEKVKHRFTQLLAWLGEPPSRTSDVLFSSLALLIDRFQAARARLAT